MTITDELREFASHCAGGMGGDSLRHIADRIDAEHGKQIDEAYATGVQDGIDADKGPREFVELPKDADGVPIRVGDVVEEFDMRTVGKARGEVIRIVFGKHATDVRIDTGTGYADRNPANVRHVDKKPTIEDMLREFAEKVIDSQIPSVHPTYEEAIAEYVAKLRLANDGKEQ